MGRGAARAAAAAGAAALALVGAARADHVKEAVVSIDGYGCYDPTSNECFCGEHSPDSCTALSRSWTKDCACYADDTGKLIDWKNSCWSSPWMGEDRWNRKCEWEEEYTGTTGEILKVVIAADFDIVAVPSQFALQNCEMSGATTLVGKRSKAVLARVRFDNPGTYYLTSTNGSGGCQTGLRMKLVISGEKVAGSDDTNPASVEYMYAPDHSKPGSEDDFQAFGKGVWYHRAHDVALNKACEAETYCLDRPAPSKGSCYYQSEDYHIGWNTFCDVGEVECCGFEGCGKRDGYHKEPSTDFHGYFWFPPGHTGPSGCCYCMAGCDMSKQDIGGCAYHDVTERNCQRSEPDGLGYGAIGGLTCKIPGRGTIDNYVLRTGSRAEGGSGSDDNAAAGVSAAGAVAALAFLGALWAF